MDIIEIIKALIIGIIEGVTEWLPISSTGHIILADELLKSNMTDAFKEMFNVVIQLGAIQAVVVLYFNRLNPFSTKKTPMERKQTMGIWYKVIVGCIPAGIIGVLFDDKIDALFYNFPTVALMLIVYGILFILVENWNKNKEFKVNNFQEMSYRTALYIGLFQVLALIPGTSRSGATIIGAMLIGTSRTVAAEYSFFLGIPIMLGASLLKLLKFGFAFTSIEAIVLLTGFISAFVVALLAIRFLMNYIKKHDFKVFGYYRIILGAIVIAYWIFR